MMGGKVPENYQEWAAYLKRLEANEGVFLSAGEIESGSLKDGADAMQKLERRIVETVNRMMNRSVKRFTKQINEALEWGEADSLLFYARRFKGQIGSCLFFRHMRFLPGEFRDELLEQACAQTFEVFGKIIKELRRIQEESQNDELDDVLYGLGRLRIFEDDITDGKLQYDKTGS